MRQGLSSRNGESLLDGGHEPPMLIAAKRQTRRARSYALSSPLPERTEEPSNATIQGSVESRRHREPPPRDSLRDGARGRARAESGDYGSGARSLDPGRRLVAA